MSLEHRLRAVLDKPESVNARAALAGELENLMIPDSQDVWVAAVRLAASRGDFFNALALARLHLHIDACQQELHHLAVLFAKDKNPQSLFSPPPEPLPVIQQIPENPQELRRLALRVGTSAVGMGRPWETPFPPLPIFGALLVPKFVALAGSIEPVPLGDKQSLVRQGSTEQAFYLLSHGTVEVCQDRPGQGSIQLAVVKAPSLVGEMSILMSTPRRASVIAQGTILAWRITASLLAQLTQSHPELINQIRKLIEQRQLKNLMRASQLFQGIEEREKLLQAFSLRIAEIDEEVFSQGAPPPGLFVILHGEAVVFTQGENGRRIRVADLHEGDTFGEFSLLTGNPTNASIWMPEGGVLLHMPATAYHTMRQFIPELESELKKLMHTRQAELSDFLTPIEHSNSTSDSWLTIKELDL